MKSLKFIIACGLFTLTSCSTYLKKISTGKSIDTRLIGVWYGSEIDKQIEGVEKKWEMTRREDGTFTLNFTFTQNGKPKNTIETGHWWIQDGEFHEYHDFSGNTDVYKYKILNIDQIKFIAKNMSIEMAAESYEFM